MADHCASLVNDLLFSSQAESFIYKESFIYDQRYKRSHAEGT